LDSSTATRGRRSSGPTSVTTADRARAREVSLRRIGALFTPYRGRLAVVTALIVVSSIVAMASPFLLRAVIDRALPTQDLTLLVWLVAGMVAVAAITAALGVVQTWISTAVGQQVMHRLRTDVFTHLQRQSIAFFTRTRTGEVQSRITNDIGGMEAVVTSTATSVASNLTTAVATAVAMVALSWQLSLVSLVVMPPAISALEPDQKSSTQIGNSSLSPSPRCTRCVCASSPPGIASRPSAASSCVPVIVPPSWAILPSAIPMSATSR